MLLIFERNQHTIFTIAVMSRVVKKQRSKIREDQVCSRNADKFPSVVVNMAR